LIQSPQKNRDPRPISPLVKTISEVPEDAKR
jgi:hypothetical protein